MSLIAQAKLLRVLEERRFERLGGNKSICGRLPPDLGDQPPARAVRPRRPLPRGSLLPRQRVRDPAAVAARAAGRHPGARAALPRALLRGAGAAARQQGVLARGARAARAAITGPATSASSKAPCRAPRCRRRAASIRAAGHRVPARDDAGRRAVDRRPAAVARRSRARAHRPRARGDATGTRRKRRACSTSAAARSTGRSSNTSSSPSRGPRAAADAVKHAEALIRTAELRLSYHLRDALRAVRAPAGVIVKDLPLAARLLRRRRARRRRARRSWCSRRTRIAQPAAVRRLLLLLVARLGAQGQPAARHRSGSTMSVSYAVDFAALLLLGADADDARRGRERLEPVHVPHADASRRRTARSSAWRRWCSR